MSARDEIVSSPTANRILDRHIDECYNDSYIACAYFEMLGRVVDQFDEWIDDLPKQSTIYTSTWGLKYWADEYNVNITPGMTYEEVRQIILNRKRKASPANEFNIENYVKAVTGTDCKITQNTGPYKFTVSFTRKKGQTSPFNFELGCKAVKDTRPAFLCFDTNIAFEDGLIIHPERSYLRFDLPLTNTLWAGTYPWQQWYGKQRLGGMVMTPRPHYGYQVARLAGTLPRVHPGFIGERSLKIDPRELAGNYNPHRAGTYPEQREVASVFEERMDIRSESLNQDYEPKFAGVPEEDETVGDRIPKIDTQVEMYEIVSKMCSEVMGDDEL